ncbi:MAG: 3TM-type holin, partial [Candidatus Thorarchaeota archaeon]|jgi:hypothetical protein
MAWWSALISPIVDSVTGLSKSVFGDAEGREKASHVEQMTVMEQFSAEFGIRENRTKWDSFVDGLNRLPRPVMTFGIIGMFWFAMERPADFALSMQSLALMPEYGWALMGTVVTFWFGGKFLGAFKKKMEPPKPEDVERIMSFYKRREEEEANG